MTVSLGARHDFLRRYKAATGWRKTQLGDLAQVVGGGTPSRDENRFWSGGNIPWATPTDVTANQGKYLSRTSECISEAGLSHSAATLLPTGSILYTSRATIGAKVITTEPMTTNQGFANLLPTHVNGEYLYYLLDLLTPMIRRLAAGTTFDEVSKRDIRTVWCAVPSELDDQIAIVRVLDAVDATLESAREALQTARAIATSLREQAVAGTLLHPSRSLSQKPDWVHPRLGVIPSGWSVERLGRACSRIVDGTHQAVETSTSGIPFLYVSCVREGRVLWGNAGLVTARTYARIAPGREPQIGSVLYTAVGSYGHAALVTTSEPFSFQRHIAILYPKAGLLSGAYLALWLNSSRGKRWSEIHAVGNAQKTVTLTELSKLTLPIPPEEIQAQMCGVVAQAEAVVDTAEHRLIAIGDLKRSLMLDLLTGRVPIPSALSAANAAAS